MITLATSGKFFKPVPGARYRYDYQAFWSLLVDKTAGKPAKQAEDETRAALQFMCKDDLFFLLYYGMGRKDMNHQKAAPFFVERCRDVESVHDRTLDLWARSHRKSSVVTIALTIQLLLKDPESTTGIFSHSRPIAKSFLDTIKGHLEADTLSSWFPEILWQSGEERPRWGLDSGLCVKRTSHRPDGTVEAWGLVDSLPTGRHYRHRVYDDIVDADSVTTKEQIDKVKERFALSHSLKEEGGTFRIVGTPYHYDDPYAEMRRSGDYITRIHTVYGGEATSGELVYFSEKEWAKVKKDNGPYATATQYLLDPVPAKDRKLQVSWVKWYEMTPLISNNYIVCDPANVKKKGRDHDPDFTVILVFGLDSRGYFYLLDGIRARLSLDERWQELKRFVRQYNPLRVGYESYGKDSDIEHFQYCQERENFRFTIVPLGGSDPKENRIQRLVPLLCNGYMLLPKSGIKILDADANQYVNLCDLTLKEMEHWPYSQHDDILDCMARITDRRTMGIEPPHDDEGMRQMAGVYGPARKDMFRCQELLI